jgi:hypothetical protein
MRAALDTLRLDSLLVIHAGKHAFPLGEGVEAVPLVDLHRRLPPLPAG